MVLDGVSVLSSISWLPGALKTGTPARAAMPRNSLYWSCMRLGCCGSFPEMVSPVQSTKAAGGFILCTAQKMFPGTADCGSLECAGRLSPARTKVNCVGFAAWDRLPVPGNGERAGIWASAAIDNNCIAKNSFANAGMLCRFILFPFMKQQNDSSRDLRALACLYVLICNASATTSMYLRPEPVLKITTLSLGFRNPSRSSR